MGVQVRNPRQVSRQVGEVRAVQPIRGREVLAPWMDEQVDLHLLHRNTRQFHLILNNKVYGSRNNKERQTPLLLLDHYILNVVKVAWEWRERVA